MRVEEIPPLAEHFLTLMPRMLGRPKPRLALANAQLSRIPSRRRSTRGHAARPIGKGIPDRSPSIDQRSYEDSELPIFFGLGTSIVVPKSGMGPASTTLALMLGIGITGLVSVSPFPGEIIMFRE